MSQAAEDAPPVVGVIDPDPAARDGLRALLRGVGVSGQGNDARGAALASYLLFEAPYTRELMALGEADTESRRDEVLAFFGWRSARAR